MIAVLLCGAMFVLGLAGAADPDATFCDCTKYEVFCEQGEPDDGVTYNDAAITACENRGGRLANLKTRRIDTILRNLIMAKGLDQFPCIANYGFWIGLNDKEKEGHYVWGDGEPLDGDDDDECKSGTFSNWYPGEPDNNEKQDPADGQDCGQLWFRGSKNGLWDDEYCNYRPKGYICEIPSEYHSFYIISKGKEMLLDRQTIPLIVLPSFANSDSF
ncbi:salivary C-type lectin 2-like [Glandiceps talaboti]